MREIFKLFVLVYAARGHETLPVSLIDIKDDEVIVMPYPVNNADIEKMRTECNTLSSRLTEWSDMIGEIRSSALNIPAYNGREDEYKYFGDTNKMRLESSMTRALTQARRITVKAEDLIADIQAVLATSVTAIPWDPATPSAHTATRREPANTPPAWNDEYHLAFRDRDRAVDRDRAATYDYDHRGGFEQRKYQDDKYASTTQQALARLRTCLRCAPSRTSGKRQL